MTLTPASPRLLLAIVALVGAITAVLLWQAVGDARFAAGFVATMLAVAAVGLVFRRERTAEVAPPATDWTLLGQALAALPEPVAVADREGRLVCVNPAYGEAFPGLPAPQAALPGTAAGDAAKAAWRDGVGVAEAGGRTITVTRAGAAEDHLVWRFAPAPAEARARRVAQALAGEPGRRLGLAGVMAALVGETGRLLAANPVFLARALGDADAQPAGRDFTDLLAAGDDDRIRIAAELTPGAPGDGPDPLRLIQLPLGEADAEGATLVMMLDEDGRVATRPDARSMATVHVHALLGMLPLGLALAERDGRLLFMNEAFERAAGIEPGRPIVYPSDLFVREDKGAVADTMRRVTNGRAPSSDLSVRLAARADEPVSLTIAQAKGLGEASVLLSLKDNSEESKLKHQIAQATKMQAVGQLAGGVAHDFNNILTAIIGHCDLMLMRHAPGDSDYDDIQQIKHNSNRAAGLTRQLLAFSRQQTLRPQVLQLPDVIAEVGNLLKRLLGETVRLEVKHGRNLGPVRADPGQLEQVIVNLAVNARDAMLEKGGGTLTIRTYGVGAEEVRELRSEVLPVGDYTALSVADTGTGIAPENLAKIFEPFFTTKELGKGTGLGLSTVYGIVKQSGGFIFADSKVGQGTSFVIYLPVHRAEPAREEAPPPKRPRQDALWGTGTILLVEDEDMVRAVAERALTRQGYRIVAAANGEAALEALALLADAGETVDLIVSDVVMPVMDGPTMATRARETHPDVPVLFMSGYAEEQLRRSIDIARVHFLPKPFSVQQLAEAARDAMALKA
ncbi:hybrid sensor histidine kinase/response regulator [Sphingomonas jatrophae]|uniref:histidine kinase n=1 Tax=Sphingomonas jatrophae TaxID=1166337 RepID=A0A1I6M2Z8_9SPHN|nr:ATP-binding protein [Sphingomonas jatrophae]SFS10085.1 two-component system, cell cycle sensor histidine kinase and response regulator CckA [Sphingomonas jatrophae]